MEISESVVGKQKKSATKIGKMNDSKDVSFAEKLGLSPNMSSYIENASSEIEIVPDDVAMKIKQKLVYGSRGVSVNLIRFMAVVITSQFDYIKKTNKWSLSVYNTPQSKNFLKEKIYKWYLRFTDPVFICKWLSDIEYDRAHFGLKEVIDQYEKFLEESLMKLGAIDKDNNVIDSDLYNEVYQSCRLYLNEKVMAEQFDQVDEKGNSKIEVFKNDGQMYRSSKSTYIDELRQLHSDFDNDVKVHKRLTTDKIQSIYEEALGIKFVDKVFEIVV